jgi:superoxide dismutase
MPRYKTPSEPLEVLAFLLDAVETYGLDYMHGLPKAEYVDAAKRAIERLERERLYTEAETLAAIKRALEGAAQSVDCACAGRETVLQCGHRNNRLRWESCGEANCLALEAADIRALDPAQFIEEPKP